LDVLKFPNRKVVKGRMLCFGMDLENKAWFYLIVAALLFFVFSILKQILVLIGAVVVGGVAIYFLSRFFGEQKGLKELKGLMAELPEKRKGKKK